MIPDVAQAQALLDDLSAQRARAREKRRGDVWVMAVTALVCLAGACVFALETPMSVMTCDAAADVCERSSSEYDGWAFWVAAAGVATVIMLLTRHVRGVRRAKPSRWASRLAAFFVLTNVAALFAGYGFATLGTDMPFMFPAAAALVLAAVAARHGDQVAAASGALVAVVIITVGMRARMTPGAAWWFDHNLGYIVSSLLAGLASAAVALRWRRMIAE